MDKNQVNALARRLETADRLTNAERVEILRDIERYARHDLYGAAKLCKDHLHERADLRLPTVVLAAERIGRHFEMRTNQTRRPVELYAEQDRQIRQPEDGYQYDGQVVGTTPNCVIQLDRETGDLIVHSRASLVCAFESTENDKQLSINYPFKAVGGVGLVTEVVRGHEKAHEHQLARGHHHAAEHAMEHNR
ncbi:hypothetical protein CAL26_01415 [Bordetella genomosp. 9]|uniref:Uncharacterized protein n=1 Tax=Bordetella genomosp. 9 TaxID=1416803 RepID=A0A261RN75_9BORD|nr:hypothetical protein [Bordetella genomosp. 9]OZI26040.1 hypothetical protein CAL26_01415 [Bordetella genomosp. 9]